MRLIDKMNLFKTNIQPTIVHASGNAILPDAAGKYFLNYNMLEIDWFEEYFMMSEDGLGMLLLEDDDNTNPLDDAVTAFTNDYYDNDTKDSQFDVPRIYFEINTDVASDDRAIVNFINILLMKSDGRGIYDLIKYTFEEGDIKFYINSVLAKYLTDIEHVSAEELIPMTLSDYIHQDGSINTDYWDELEGVERDYTNLDYYASKNVLANAEFDIENFYSTFCSLILDYTLIEDSDLNTINNQIYQQVLNYYKNMKSDAASRGIDLILGSTINEVNPIASTCACSNKFSSSAEELSTCSNLYKSAMLEYLKQMLGDADFYYDWLCIPEAGDANEPLVDALIRLIEAINDPSFDLSLGEGKRRCRRNVCSSSISKSDAVSEANHTILSNYLKVLGYVKDGVIDTKKNSIKVYGQEFAELLDKLQF